MYILIANLIGTSKPIYYGPFNKINEATAFINMMDVELWTFEIKQLIRPTANAD